MNLKNCLVVFPLAWCTFFSSLIQAQPILKASGRGRYLHQSNLVASSALTSANMIWSDKPASEWSEGYPIGNGRIGGMVLGQPEHERISLNHDLLWRKFWSYQKHYTATDIPTIRDFAMQDKWEDAEAVTLKKVAVTGKPIYVNPYVPAGDLYIDMIQQDQKVTDYVRSLDMNNGMVDITYRAAGILFKRESFCSWKQGVMITRLTADKAAALTGEVSLSRLQDPECLVTGYAHQDKVVLKGQFEEGRQFAIVAKIIQRGGRLTGGRKEFIQNKAGMPGKDFGLKYVFSTNDMFGKDDGASTYFDHSDEVLILLAITVDDEYEKGADLVKKASEKLDGVNKSFETLKKEHIADFQKIYNRVSFSLGSENPVISTDSLLKKCIADNTASAALLERMFNMSRYLAISSGRPQPLGQPAKAPINLQGIWNQDRRPAWDCDYHLDLNLPMCYWPLDMVHLGDLMNPLMDWVERVMPQGKIAARDLYGCNGVYFPITCDYSNVGNVDNIGFYWTGGAAWLAQILWQHWEYTNDLTFLKDHLYPFMDQIGRFYEDFLVKNKKGYLVPSLSASPEMPIAGRIGQSFLSSASTIDLELIRDVFTHLVKAGKRLKVNPATLQKWESILARVPLPGINKDGSLAEWMEDHTPGDPGHRHRSPFIGLAPGDRISMENTPEDAAAAYRLLQKRHSFGKSMTQSLTFVWDAQLLDRLGKGNEAFDQLKSLIPIHLLNNLLLTCNDWGGKGGLAWFKDIKLFQIEANIGLASAIIEMIFQDRQDLLRFLPALPSALPDGKVTGLRARGEFEVGLEWEKGTLRAASILSDDGMTCHFKDNGYSKIKIACGGEEIKYVNDKGIISFATAKGQTYHLTFF